MIVMAAKKKAAKAKAPKAAKPKAEAKPRTDTKLAQAEGLLRKGITIPALGKELGWNGNTVRGVFARFRKDNKTITGTKRKGEDTLWKMAA
jgi:hypothetical protein